MAHFSMKLQKQIFDLVDAGVITPETAKAIEGYYRAKEGSSNRLLIIFGILGAILVGLGIILIIAHNWDEFSIGLKTGIGLLPLLIGQAVCGYALFFRSDQTALRESSATFTFFAIGATLSIMSQVYNIQGELSSYLFTWMLLALPLIYVMRSSMTSLLYLAGITYYAVEKGYWTYDSSAPYYWLFILGVLPHYFMQIKKCPGSNFTVYHHWLLPISLIISLGTFADKDPNWLFVAYVSLFGIFCGLGHSGMIAGDSLRQNSYKILGALGTVVVLLVLSFDWFWQELRTHSTYARQDGYGLEFYAAWLLTLIALALFVRNLRKNGFSVIHPVEPVFFVFAITFLLGYVSPVSVVLVNLYIFIIGLMTTRLGARLENLGILNYGLLVITALVLCRFFDSDLNFVVKGFLFLLVGFGFFGANYYLIKKRKSNA